MDGESRAVSRTAGPFRHRLARARLDRIFTSTAAAGLFTELMLGTL